jgi:K+-sensing histidine kinase KdpD
MKRTRKRREEEEHRPASLSPQDASGDDEVPCPKRSRKLTSAMKHLRVTQPLNTQHDGLSDQFDKLTTATTTCSTTTTAAPARVRASILVDLQDDFEQTPTTTATTATTTTTTTAAAEPTAETTATTTCTNQQTNYLYAGINNLLNRLHLERQQRARSGTLDDSR